MYKNTISVANPIGLSTKLCPLMLIVLFAGVTCPAFTAAAQVATTEEVLVKLPDRVSITKVAGNDLVPDAYCLTLDPDGNPVVAGRDYVRRLTDTDGDGIYDKAEEICGGYVKGAQGMCFSGNELFCTANGGFFKCSVSEGGNPPRVENLIKLTSGGEHTAHAVRVGPDGWLYVLCGNQTEILPEFYSHPYSPVKKPQAGFLMRFQTKSIFGQVRDKRFQIVCDGFRNAYDFDFGPDGSIYVYDSDGERDVSLPWYRPTRVYRMRPGDNAGWVSASWKRPSYFFDMPETVAKLGRGSPTGVVVSNDLKFDDGVYVGDWTFGRIEAVNICADAKELKSTEPLPPSVKRATEVDSPFAQAKGQFGFAVTDMEFLSKTKLLVTVGGRGTEGALYCINIKPTELRSSKELLDPEWLPLVQGLRELNFERIDAGLLKLVVGKSLESEVSELRLAGLESLVGCEKFLTGIDPETKQGFIGSLQSVIQAEKLDATTIRLIRTVFSQLANDDRRKVMAELSTDRQLLLIHETQITTLPDLNRLDWVEDLVKAQDAGIDRLHFVRAAQLALGGCDGNGMFAGYTAKNPVTPAKDHAGHETIEQALLELHTEGGLVRKEAARLAAMLRFESAEYRKQLVAQLTDDSNPIADIHWLNCIAMTRGELDQADVDRVSNGLLQIRRKIRKLGLPTDRNWIPRMQELSRKLFEDLNVAKRLVEIDSLGIADDAYLFSEFPPSVRSIAAEKFAQQASSNPDDVSREQLRVIASVGNKDVLRKFNNDPGMIDVVIEGLSQKPEPVDRAIFAKGIASWEPSTVKRSAVALRRLGQPGKSLVESGGLKSELESAIATAFRLGFDKQSVSVRDQIVMYWRTVSGRAFGYMERQPDPNAELKARQLKAIGKWSEFFQSKYGVEVVDAGTGSDLLSRLGEIDFSAGDVKRGRAVFVARQCATCHDRDRGTKLGPQLDGITNRFSQQSVFESIVNPHAQVPDRYRALLIATEDGKLYQGSMVYESADGITLMDVTGKTLRINRDDIEERKRLEQSLMPSGLFDGVTDEEVADFWAYLSTLK